jgi:hypothetical protein
MPITSEVGVELSADTSKFHAQMAGAADAVGTVAGQIQKKFELKDLGRTMATALGLNLESMAEAVARFYTGVSKAEEEALKKWAETSTRAADATIAAMRAGLTEEQKLQLAMQERDRLVERISDRVVRTTADQIAQDQDRARAAELIVHIRAAVPTQAAAAARTADSAHAADLKRRGELAEAQAKADREQLSAAAQVRALKDDILALETLLAGSSLNEANRAELTNRLHERRKELVTAQADQKKLEADYDQLQADMMIADLAAQEERRRLLRAQAEEMAGQVEQAQELEETTSRIVELQRYGQGTQDISDRQLAEKIANLRALMTDLELSTQLRPGDLRFTHYYGLKSELMSAEQEQQMRSLVARNVAMYGEQGAYQRSGISAVEFDRILRLINPSAAADTATAVRSIAHGLQQRGIIPRY